MNYLSIFSGIEAATVAWEPLGWQAIAYSEIEPFPCSVLAHHYPRTPNWGDAHRYEEWPDAAVDVLVGGSPCQSFSLAGLRKGLDDPRGNLTTVYLAIAARYRPRWVVWENVPGVLSIDSGRTFGACLGALAKLGYGWAYRILDAQHFGLAQRRRRVFVIGCLGGWGRAAAVLFERASLCGNPAQGGEARHETAGGVASCLGGRGHASHRADSDTYVPRIVAQAMSAKWSKWSAGPAGDEHHNLVVTHALRAPIVPIAFSSKDCGIDAGVTAPTLRNGGGQVAALVRESNAGMAVRRLTPTECERLMGFADQYTLVPHRGRPTADSPRYRALGNSMAVPVVRWIGGRIAQVEEIQ